LYLPVVLTGLGGIGVFVLLAFALRLGFAVAGVVGALPFVVVVAWIVALRRGRHAGYDRDRIEEMFGGGDFARDAKDQEDIA
jgi:hypothetical protein